MEVSRVCVQRNFSPCANKQRSQQVETKRLSRRSAHIYTPYIYGTYIYTSYRKNLNKAFSRQICGNQTTRQRFGLSASNFLFFAFVVGGVLLFVQKRWCLSASHHHRTLFSSPVSESPWRKFWTLDFTAKFFGQLFRER